MPGYQWKGDAAQAIVSMPRRPVVRYRRPVPPAPEYINTTEEALQRLQEVFDATGRAMLVTTWKPGFKRLVDAEIRRRIDAGQPHYKIRAEMHISREYLYNRFEPAERANLNTTKREREARLKREAKARERAGRYARAEVLLGHGANLKQLIQAGLIKQHEANRDFKGKGWSRKQIGAALKIRNENR